MAGSWKLAGGVLLLLLPLLPLASSSMRFRLEGSVYPTGYFYVTMRIGEQEKPYFLDIDTGSTLIWLECEGKDKGKYCNKVPHPLYRGTADMAVPCADPLCDAQHRDLGTTKDCKQNKNVCRYKTTYLDGLTSQGLLLLDKLALPTGISPTVAFGCGYDQTEGGKKQPVSMPVDGTLGLGRGSVDLVSQLKHKGAISRNVIGHYLSTRGGGSLSIGEDVPSSGVTWVPMAPATRHYSPGRGTLHLDTKSIGTGLVKTIFDSGATYTYLPERVHVQLVSVLKASLSKSLKEVPDHALNLCWKGPKPFKTLEDLKKEFKPVMSLKFDHGATMTIPPENYLIITERGNACFGILPINSGVYIIGAITMQDRLMIYDNEKGRIGWMPSPSPKL